MVLNYLAIENLRFTEICLKYSKINVTKRNKSKRHYSNPEIQFKDGSKPFFKLHQVSGFLDFLQFTSNLTFGFITLIIQIFISSLMYLDFFLRKNCVFHVTFWYLEMINFRGVIIRQKIVGWSENFWVSWAWLEDIWWLHYATVLFSNIHHLAIARQIPQISSLVVSRSQRFKSNPKWHSRHIFQL